MIATEVGFEEAWQVAAGIDGWLTERDARLLFHSARNADGLVVEVGAYRGKSTTVMASAKVPLVTVDPLVPGDYPEESMTITEDDALELRRNLKPYPMAWWVRLHSTDYIPPHPVGMLYLDGKHSGDQPHKDFRHYAEFLMDGAIVAFHDYNCRNEVKEAVKTAEDSRRLTKITTGDSLYIGQFHG